MSTANGARHLLATFLDGEFPWGAVIASSMRHGARQRRLIVYPPGITAQERRWLRVWRGWPLWGALLWFGLHAHLLQTASPWHATAVATGVWVATGMVAFAMAGDSRRQVRTANSVEFAAADDSDRPEGQRTVRLLTTTLLTADALHRRGELSTVEYERVWWQVYDAMAPTSEARQRG